MPRSIGREGGVRAFRLIPDRTVVRFTTRHLAGLGRVSGTVDVLEGRLLADAGAALLALDVDLDLGTFRSGVAARDAAVARLLEVGRHPVARYRSAAAAPAGTGWVVHGVLTVRGTDAPVDLHVDDLREAEPLAAHATARVDRVAHGIVIPSVIASRHLLVDITAHAERVAAG